MIGQADIWVMAGGAGERFWPLSRAHRPKHLIPLFGEKTLLELTLQRLEGLVPAHQLFILTGDAALNETRRLLPHFPADQVIVEPERRDTAAAIALGTALSMRRNPESVVVFLPADAWIEPTDLFQRQLTEAIHLAQQTEALVTLAIPPRHPSTLFGYLKLGEPCVMQKGKSLAYWVQQFVEKPDAAKAQDYLASGDYLWNSGIFIWKTSAFLREAARVAPQLETFVRDVAAAAEPWKKATERFTNIPKQSIDYALLEKAERVATVRSEFEWDDMGSWLSFFLRVDPDRSGNRAIDPEALIARRAENNAVYSMPSKLPSHNTKPLEGVQKKRLIALCGINDLIVVDTDDALLICHENALDELKKLHAELPPAWL